MMRRSRRLGDTSARLEGTAARSCHGQALAEHAQSASQDNETLPGAGQQPTNDAAADGPPDAPPEVPRRDPVHADEADAEAETSVSLESRCKQRLAPSCKLPEHLSEKRTVLRSS